MLKITRDSRQCRVELFQGTRLNTLFSGLVKQQLRELVEEPGAFVVFDLEGIRFIDTAGFEMLQEITNHANLYGSRFRLCNISDDVKELIILLRLETQLSFCDCMNIEEKIQVVLD